MSRYKIDAIWIYNFKVFDDFAIDFKTSHLVLLGGPNGYGKTTIFDAVELALTGNIERFTKIDISSGSSDNVVAKDVGKKVGIKITLSNQQRTIEIKRKLKELSSLKKDNKIANFNNLWDLELVENNQTRSITQKELEEIINESSFANFFNSFFYIQQEETAHFLKNNEKQRLEKLAQLFNLTKEEKELEKTQTLKKNIERVILKTKNDELTTLTQSIDNTVSRSKNNIEYQKLLTWLEALQLWDKQELSFQDGKNTKDKYIEELNSIKVLIQHKKEFLDYYKVSYFKQNQNVIKAMLVGYHFFEDYQNYKQQNEEKKKLKQFLLNLNKEEEIFSLDAKENIYKKVINFKILQDKIDFDLESLDKKIDSIVLQKNNLSSSNQVINDLMNFRNKLIESFNQSNLDKNKCPLCGHDWIESQNLIDSLTRKKELLEKLLDSDTAKYQEDLKELNEQIGLLKNAIEELLKKADYQISDSYIDALTTYQEHKNNIKKFFDYLARNEIDITDLLYTDISLDIDQNELDSRVVHIITELDNKFIFSDGFKEANSTYNFVSLYENIFKKNEQNLNVIKIDDIENKKSYIEQQYYQFNKAKQDKINKLNHDIGQLNTLVENLKRLEKIYKDEIGKQRAKMIKDIEIPLYIYSGKILQSFRENSTQGIYIKDTVRGEQLGNIRFVSKWDSDHDVINTTSSGQLAGIVIALTLALNKVYSKGFNTILIDDPVQSMDDINMISLVELLRNDFKNKQIFISTHEDSIEKYILYKFIKNNQSVCRVDMLSREVYHSD